MKILFLDIDGVLNSGAFIATKKLEQSLVPSKDSWWQEMLDPNAIDLLNRLLRRTEAKVVVSSSWRHALEVEDLRRILGGVGFKGEVIGMTPKRGGLCRGDRIKLWLDSVDDIESFVILDDDDDMGGFDERLVLTDGDFGLRPKDCEAAEQILRLSHRESV